MRTFEMLCALVLILTVTVFASAFGPQVEPGSNIEITEIRNVGVSAVNQSRAIVQVSWVTANTPTLQIRSFEVQLEVLYADGAIEQSSVNSPGNIRSNRFEVPTSHRLGSNPAAEIKSFKASITATYSATTTKQVLL